VSKVSEDKENTISTPTEGFARDVDQVARDLLAKFNSHRNGSIMLLFPDKKEVIIMTQDTTIPENTDFNFPEFQKTFAEKMKSGQPLTGGGGILTPLLKTLIGDFTHNYTGSFCGHDPRASEQSSLPPHT
jgi:hypothetical protein